MLLLIYPPFAMPDKPYIGLPTLAAHLVQNNIPVKLWDANLTFFRQKMSPSELEKGLEQSRNYLKKLDEEPSLSLPQLVDYAHRAGAIGRIEDDGGVKDLFLDSTLSNQERMHCFSHYLYLINSPDSSESLSMTENTGYLRYKGPGSLFSSRDLIRFAGKEGSLTHRACQCRLKTLLEKERPCLVGISVTFPDQIQAALTLASMVKALAPELPVVLGGAYVTIHMKTITNPELFSLVDCFALGDGELILDNLYRLARLGPLTPEGLARIKGLIYTDGAGIVATGPPQVFPMSGSPAPAYTLLPLDQYSVPHETGAVLFRLSRGCYWAKCAFCNSLSSVINHYDHQDPEVVFKQLIQTLKETGCRVVHFTDDAADPDMLYYIAGRMIRENLKLNWTVNVRVDKRLTLEMLVLLKKAGCFSLYLGIESCNNRILDLMNKGVHTRQIHQVLSNISWAGIHANIYMIIGFPTETLDEAKESFDQVVDWLKTGLVNRVVYNRFVLAPASPVAMNPARYQIIATDNSTNGDLCPPYEGFECRSGMSRDTVKKYYGEIIRTLSALSNDRLTTDRPKDPAMKAVPWPSWARYSKDAIKQQLLEKGMNP